MKKRLVTIVLAVVIAVGLMVPALAAGYGRGVGGTGRGVNLENFPRHGLGNCGLGYAFMCDDDGNFLDREAFEAKIEKAISEGLIAEADKDLILEMYDYCSEYGCGALGVAGGLRRGCGRGRWIQS